MDITFSFSQDAIARLEALKVKAQAADYAEVIRNAIQLYEGMIAATEGGYRWILKAPDGNLQPFQPVEARRLQTAHPARILTDIVSLIPRSAAGMAGFTLSADL